VERRLRTKAELVLDLFDSDSPRQRELRRLARRGAVWPWHGTSGAIAVGC